MGTEKAKRKPAAKQPKKRETAPSGDPELVDRLKRAAGAYLVRTGESVTWRQLGELAGLTPSSMTDVLNAARKVTIAEAQLWADHLGVRFEWLAIGRGAMIVMTPEDARRFGPPPAEGQSAGDYFQRQRDDKKPTRGER